MIGVDSDFFGRAWSYEKYVEFEEWLQENPRFNDLTVDEDTLKIYFDNEHDATLFVLRWS
jgi:hypothetical protein